MNRSSLFRLVLALGCLPVFLTACSRDPNVRKQKYFESGQRFFAKGEYREAVIEFRNATEVDSGFTAAHYQLAQTYLKLQDWPHAFNELSRTLDLQPDNYKAQIDIANLLIANGQLKAAQDHTDLLLSKLPNDPGTHIAVANLDGKEGKYDLAIAETQKAIALGPDRGDSYLNLALLQTQVHQFDAAEANFKKAIELKATGANPHLALAAFYQSRGRYPEAEQQVQIVIDSDAKDVGSRAAMVELYMAQGKKAEAEALAKQVKHDLPDNPDAYRMLGDYYVAIADLDRAISEYASIHSDHPKDMQVSRNYVQLLILKNRLDDANRVNEESLKAKPKDDDSLTLRGEIQMGQGKLNEAVQTLQSVVSDDPGNAIAHYQLGNALSLRSELDQAAKEWQEAVSLKPTMVEADRALAGLALQKGDMSALEQAATQIISLQPGAPDGYAARSFSFTKRGRFPAAEQDARKAIQIAPQSPSGYLGMGNLCTAEGKFSEAESWYKQSLSRDPSSGEALGGLLNVYLLMKQPDKAVAAANTQITLSPNNSGFYSLLGTVLMGRKDYGPAQTAFTKAIELNKNNTDAYSKLCQTQALSGALDQAIATCNDGLRDNPKEGRLYIQVGSLYEAKHDLDKAQAAYNSALQIKRDDPVASNNLAYLLLETGGNNDLALQLAQTARRGLPESSNVADTLGWAFYQKGVYPSAIENFQAAMKLAAKNKEPDSPLYHYHLGLAYAKSDQPALARQHLERVLKLDPNYSKADDVRKQLAQLKS